MGIDGFCGDRLQLAAWLWRATTRRAFTVGDTHHGVDFGPAHRRYRQPPSRHHSGDAAQPDLVVPIHNSTVVKMATHSAFTTAGLRTPGAAAVAGLLFSFL